MTIVWRFCAAFPPVTLSIAYSPQNAILQKLLDDALKEEITNTRAVSLVPLPNARELESLLMQRNYIGGIEFPDSYTVSNRVLYTSGMSADPLTNRSLVEHHRSTTKAAIRYSSSGRVTILRLGVRKLAHQLHGRPVRPRTAQCQPIGRWQSQLLARRFSHPPSRHFAYLHSTAAGRL